MHESGSGPPVRTAEEMSLCDMIKAHEARSQERYEHLMAHVDERCEDVEDHVSKHVHHMSHHHSGDEEMSKDHEGLGLAALAALSQKGVGNDISPLALTALTQHGHGYGWGGGGLAGAALGFVAGALVNGGRRGGGLFGGGGGDDCCCDNGAETRIEDQIANTAIQDKLGTLQGAVPLATAQLENVMLEQTIANNNLLSQLQIGLCQSFANVNQNIAAVNQNVSEQGCATRSAVQLSTQAILERINANTIAELQADLAEARHIGRGHASDLTVTQTVNQAQVQAQQQQQSQAILAALNGLAFSLNGLTQIAHATNQNVIAGNAGAVTTGAQSANPVNVA